MHFMPEDEGYVEKLWPDSFKDVIKNEVRTVIAAELNAGQTLQRVYKRHYAEKFNDLDQFTNRIAEMLVIGAEKGADDVLDDTVHAFLYECPLPEARIYARYLSLRTLPQPVRQRLMEVIVDEYRQDDVYINAYRVGYYGRYRDFDVFLHNVAELVVAGVVNGADDMLAAIYRAFLTGGPLPPARRNARRVKNWFVPRGSRKREAPGWQQLQ